LTVSFDSKRSDKIKIVDLSFEDGNIETDDDTHMFFTIKGIAKIK
jgi:hypothetical protein